MIIHQISTKIFYLLEITLSSFSFHKSFVYLWIFTLRLIRCGLIFHLLSQTYNNHLGHTQVNQYSIWSKLITKSESTAEKFLHKLTLPDFWVPETEREIKISFSYETSITAQDMRQKYMLRIHLRERQPKHLLNGKIKYLTGRPTP